MISWYFDKELQQRRKIRYYHLEVCHLIHEGVGVSQTSKQLLTHLQTLKQPHSSYKFFFSCCQRCIDRQKFCTKDDLQQWSYSAQVVKVGYIQFQQHSLLRSIAHYADGS